MKCGECLNLAVRGSFTRPTVSHSSVPACGTGTLLTSSPSPEHQSHSYCTRQDSRTCAPMRMLPSLRGEERGSLGHLEDDTRNAPAVHCRRDGGDWTSGDLQPESVDRGQVLNRQAFRGRHWSQDCWPCPRVRVHRPFTSIDYNGSRSAMTRLQNLCIFSLPFHPAIGGLESIAMLVAMDASRQACESRSLRPLRQQKRMTPSSLSLSRGRDLLGRD